MDIIFCIYLYVICGEKLFEFNVYKQLYNLTRCDGLPILLLFQNFSSYLATNTSNAVPS